MDRVRRNWVEAFNRYREIVVDYLGVRIEYFNDNSTLKVFGHAITFTRIPLFKRTFWMFTLLACFYAAGSVLRGALQIYRADAVSFSVETDYLHWDTPFPGVTLCERRHPVISKEYLVKHNMVQLANYLKERWDDIEAGCKLCANCKLNKTCIDDIAGLIDALRTPCEEFFGDCWWDGEKQPCCELFKPMHTQYGLCYTFNSKFNDDDLKYINRKVGVPSLMFTNTRHALMKVHSPSETISAISGELTKCNKLNPFEIAEVIVRAEETYSDISVRSIPKYSRDCLFEDELPDFVVNWPFKRYSRFACFWYCLAIDQYKFCNCTYYYMPEIDLGDGAFPVCGVAGLNCLKKYSDDITTDSCQCPINCDEVNYEETHIHCTRKNEKVVDGPPGTRMIRVGQLPALRIRRHAIRDTLGLVVDFGGVIGVFFGASLLSFIEIVYIFCLRRN